MQKLPLLLLLLCWLPARPQNEQKTFWALNGSATAFTWDNTAGATGNAGNNRIDNGTGTWNSTGRTWTFNRGTTDIVWQPNSAAIFGGNPGTGAAGTVTLAANQIVRSLTFNPAASGTFTLATNTITNTTGNIIANANAAIGSILAGSAGLTLTGTSTITLTSVPTYTGTTTLSSGTLQLSNGVSSSLASSLSTPIVIASGATLAADILNSNINISGNISGAGTLSIAATGTQTQTLRLYGNNSGFTGNFIAPSTTRGLMWSDNAGAGNAANTGSASAAWSISSAFGLIESSTGTSPVVQLGSLTGANSATTLGAFGTGTGTRTFQIGALNTGTTFAGAIQDNPQGGSAVVALTKVGSGILIMSGTNTYTGITTVNAGTLSFSNSISSGTWNIAVNATSTPALSNSGTLIVPGQLLTGLLKTVNIILTGASTGFTWTAVTYTSLNLLGPTLQINGTNVLSGVASGGTTVTSNGTTITVKR